MKHMRFALALVVLAVMMQAFTPLISSAGAAALRKPVQEVMEAIGRYVAKKGGRELTEELAGLGGEAVVKRVAERALREGGDDALGALVRATRSYGPDVIRVADEAVNVPRLLRAVDALPEGMGAQAVRRLAAGTDGALLQTVERYGTQALRAEVSHPGIGGRVVRGLGEEGAEIALRSTPQQMLTLSRHVDDIARLPGPQKEGIVRLLENSAERFTAFMGDFVKNNPGKVLFTVAATPIILMNSEALLGGEGEIVFGPDGNPVFVPRPGMMERGLMRVLDYLLPILAIGAACWIGIRLWSYRKLTTLRHNLKEQELMRAAENTTSAQPAESKK